MAALASHWQIHLRLLTLNRWMEFNESWQKVRSQCPPPSLCFLGRSKKKNKMAALASDWLRHWLNGIQRNLTRRKNSTSSTKFVFSGRSKKQDGRPGLWLAEAFSTSPQKPLNGIQWNLTGSKISMSSATFVFSGNHEKCGMEWNGIVEWNCGMEWNGFMNRIWNKDFKLYFRCQGHKYDYLGRKGTHSHDKTYF